MHEDNIDIDGRTQNTMNTISENDEGYSTLNNLFLTFFGHPYFSRLSIAILYVIIFNYLLSFQFYPYHYIIFMCSIIFLLSLINKSYAIALGLIFTFPIYIYQNIQFALLYMTCCAILIIISDTDWRISFLILASFTSAFKFHYSISIILILLSGYLYGKRKGFLTGFLASTFITIFAISFNYHSVGLFFFPQSATPIFTIWKSPPNPFIISNIFTIYRDEMGNIFPLIYLLSNKFSIIIQLITTSVGGYIAGDVLTWKIKYNSVLALIVGSTPILFGLALSETMIRNSFMTLRTLGIPFLFIMIIISISSLMWKPVLYIIGSQTLTDLELPSGIKSELNMLKKERDTYYDEKNLLQKELENYKKDSVQLRFIRGSLESDNKSVSVLKLSTIMDASELEEEKVIAVLKELEKAGMILIHKDVIIDKSGVRDKILEKLQNSNL